MYRLGILMMSACALLASCSTTDRYKAQCDNERNHPLVGVTALTPLHIVARDSGHVCILQLAAVRITKGPNDAEYRHAHSALNKLIAGQEIHVVYERTDSVIEPTTGRIAYVWCGGRFLNAEIIRLGCGAIDETFDKISPERRALLRTAEMGGNPADVADGDWNVG